MELAGGVFIFIGLIFFFAGLRQRTVQSDMRDIKRMEIRDLRPGMVAEISGVAQLEPPLLTPFSGVQCAWYELEVERYEYVSGKHGQSWHRVWREETNNRFKIYDGTGTISVTPSEATIRAPQVFERTIQAGEVFPRPDLRKLVNLIGGYQARVRERAIAIGTSVYAFGSMFSSADKLYMMRGKRPLYISTKPEESVQEEVGRKGALYTIAGLLGIFGGFTLIFLRHIL